MMVRRLTSSDFAALAADHPAIVEELSLTLIHESDLPADWLSTTVGCYSTESGYYALAQYDHIAPLKSQVDEFAADRLVAAGCRSVIDVGVGDGHRLLAIATLVEKRTGTRPTLYGIELSEEMAALATGRGVDVVRQDMREGIPNLRNPLDAVLFLSGDLGYLMDPDDGAELRRRVLDSAYERLRPGGVVVLELITRDPRRAPDGADVFYFSRAPHVHGGTSEVAANGPETWQYIKTFTRSEFRALVVASRFELDGASMRYIVRASDDVGRVGCFVGDDELVEVESYRLLAALMK